jgi:diguanylate cyclase (GGDEF)-like protein
MLREQLLLSLEVFRQSLRIDSDTGVYNKKYFTRMLEDELFQHPEESLSVGIVKIIFFDSEEELIENYPIAVLQKVLRQTTDLLRNELRGNDHISRWDDTSFIVMLPNTNGKAAARIFDRIHNSLKSSVDIRQFGLSINLDSKIGAAEKYENISSQDLVENARNALEQARREKGAPVVVWDPQSALLLKNTTGTA